MIDVSSMANIAVDDCLGAVAVRVAHERPVVALGVLRALPRFAVVRTTRAYASAPERLNILTRGRDERDMEMPGRRMLAVRSQNREVVPLDLVHADMGRFDTQ